MHTAVWFQRNLRIDYNEALNWALHRAKLNQGKVALFYLHSPEDEAPWQRGAASSWWLQQSLSSLKSALSQQGLVLNIIKGGANEAIPNLLEQHNIDAISWQRNHEPHLFEHEEKLAEQLTQQGVTVNITNDSMLTHPNQLMTQKGTPYKVFTPFYRQLRKELHHINHDPTTPAAPNSIASMTLDCSQSLDTAGISVPHRWQQKLAEHHQPGEQHSQQLLLRFVTERLYDYPLNRDFPAIEATSVLAAPLHFGEISIRQVIALLQPIIEEGDPQHHQAAEVFLRQLIWREFARYILWHFPDTTEQSMNKRFDASLWAYDEERLRRWQRGETGVVLIDAGMKQLWQTGTMHNRVRMLVASYLTKNLAQPWQLGARWFWETLVDADLANNSMGWQWVAGTGVDAAPYFRIFNPETQAKKFDPDNLYQQRWNNADPQPEALVDLGDSRREALHRYQENRKRNSLQ